MGDTLDPAQRRRRSSRPTTCAASSPEQIDEDLARATGAAFVAVTGATERGGRATTCGRARPALAGAFADGATAAGADVVMIGLASTDQLYFASGHLGLPGRDVHRQPQPGGSTTASRCVAPAPSRSAPRPASPTSATWSPQVPRRPRPRGSARSPSTTSSRPTPPTCSRSPRSPVAALQGRRRRRQRDGRPHRPGGLRAAGRGPGRPGADVLRARRHLPEPRGQPDRPRRTCATCRRRGRARAPTSASPSTATPTAASWSTSGAQAVSPSTLTGADRLARAGPAPGRRR